MDKNDAVELLRFAKAAERSRWDDAETTAAYNHMAIMFAAAAGMTKSEIFRFLNRQMSHGSALLLVEKYENKYDKMMKG